MAKGQEIKGQTYLTMFMSEFLGTALLLFLGCMGCISNYADEPKAVHHAGGLIFGLTVMLIIQIFGHISGAHLNPAVTMAAALFGLLEYKMAGLYILAQFMGASAGYGMLRILASDRYVADGFCITSLNKDIGVMQGLAIEIVITMVLVLICCAIWDKRNEAKVDSVPLRFGLSLALLCIVAGPLTGASMNTARSFAPLLFGGSWQHHWVYWLGPNIGAFLGCGVYKYLLDESENKKPKKEDVCLNEVSYHAPEKN